MKTSFNNNFLTVPEIRTIQESKLKDLLHYLSARSPYYQNIFKKNQIDIGRIRGLDDLAKLPTTTKDQLQAHNEAFLCVPKSSIVEYTSTSGTLGVPVSIALTENDMQRLATNECNAFQCAGCGPEDIFQLMLTLDRQFMAGMAYFMGIRKLGAGIIRVGPGVPSLQWETIFSLKPTVLIAVPSFILKMLQYAADHRIDPAASSVKKAICIGENIRQNNFSLNILGNKIKSSWNIQLISTYASTEMQTAFTECGAAMGGHLQPDLLIAELLDDQDQPVPPGVAGEVTITTLGVEGMPLLRYKTGDLCIAHTEACSCGRQTPRLSPVIGRKKQMIKFKGTTLFAPALFDLLTGMEDITDFVAEVFSNDIGTDDVLLHLLPVELSEDTDHRIRSYLQAKLRVTPQIHYTTAEELQKLQFPTGGRKAVKFIDRRTSVGG